MQATNLKFIILNMPIMIATDLKISFINHLLTI
jgi:hypothetical protein